MLTVLMECRDQESELAQTLAILVSAAVEGLVSDVIILDHGSKDGSSRVADAAGCHFLSDWNVDEVLGRARGEWLLLIEPGARPQAGWIEEVIEFVALNRRPACFAPSRSYRRPFLKRIAAKKQPLEYGLLLPKPQALQLAKRGEGLHSMVAGQKPATLISEMIPAWVARSAR
jgi:hypothetical protein